VISDTKRSKDPSADLPAAGPRNPLANLLPTAGFVLEIDGKFKSEYEISEQALKAGLELKLRYPHIQVMVFNAKKRTRIPVKVPEQSEKKLRAIGSDRPSLSGPLAMLVGRSIAKHLCQLGL
jgi:hypothetical protein